MTTEAVDTALQRARERVEALRPIEIESVRVNGGEVETFASVLDDYAALVRAEACSEAWDAALGACCSSIGHTRRAILTQSQKAKVELQRLCGEER